MEEEVFKYLEENAIKIKKSKAIKKLVKRFRLEKFMAKEIYEKWRRIWCSNSNKY